MCQRRHKNQHALQCNLEGQAECCTAVLLGPCSANTLKRERVTQKGRPKTCKTSLAKSANPKTKGPLSRSDFSIATCREFKSRWHMMLCERQEATVSGIWLKPCKVFISSSCMHAASCLKRTPGFAETVLNTFVNLSIL